MATHLRPLSFGEILDGAFTLYRRHPLPLLAAALLGSVPILPMLYAADAAATRLGAGTEPAVALVVVATMVIALPIQWAALTRMTSQAYTGGAVSVGDGYRAGARAWPMMMGAAIAWVVCLLVAFFALALTVGILGGILGVVAGPLGAALMMALSYVAIVVFYLVCIALAFAIVPAIVVEDKGPLDSLWRSVQLARGALGRVLGVVFVGWLIVMLPSLAAMLLTGSASALLDPAAAAAPSSGPSVVRQLLGLVAYVAYVGTFPFMTAALVLLYYDRRARLEAHDLEGLVEGLSTAH